MCYAPQVEAAQALGVGVLEALAAGGAPAEVAQRVGAAVVLARQAAAAADASLLRCSAVAPAAAGGAGPEPAAQQRVRSPQVTLMIAVPTRCRVHNPVAGDARPAFRAILADTADTALNGHTFASGTASIKKFQTADLVTAASLGRQDAEAWQDGAARQAAHALAAFGASLEPLREALDPCRNTVPPCRRPPKRRRAEGPGAISGPGAQSGSESQAAALEALAARVAAATRFSVVLARGGSGSGGAGRTPASSAPYALNLST